MPICSLVTSKPYVSKSNEKDKNALCFLWAIPDGNIVHLPSHLLLSLVYCSHNICTEKDSKTICKSFYVDDLYKSCLSKSELQEILYSTQATSKLVRFNLTKFIANDETIMQHISKADQSKKAKMPSKT